MPNPLQNALNEAMDALAADTGLSFRFGSIKFNAWPTEQPREMEGRLLGSPDQLHWYETRVAPVFKIGQTLESDGKQFTVSKRLQVDPYTGAFKFAILPGRST